MLRFWILLQKAENHKAKFSKQILFSRPTFQKAENSLGQKYGQKCVRLDLSYQIFPQLDNLGYFGARKGTFALYFRKVESISI